MLQRILTWAIRSYVRGPGRSWVYTTLALGLLRLIRRVTGRRPVVETLAVGRGQTLSVEGLEISHRKQIREQRRERRLARRPSRRD